MDIKMHFIRQRFNEQPHTGKRGPWQFLPCGQWVLLYQLANSFQHSWLLDVCVYFWIILCCDFPIVALSLINELNNTQAMLILDLCEGHNFTFLRVSSILGCQWIAPWKPGKLYHQRWRTMPSPWEMNPSDF